MIIGGAYWSSHYDSEQQEEKFIYQVDSEERLRYTCDLCGNKINYVPEVTQAQRNWEKVFISFPIRYHPDKDCWIKTGGKTYTHKKCVDESWDAVFEETTETGEKIEIAYQLTFKGLLLKILPSLVYYFPSRLGVVY